MTAERSAADWAAEMARLRSVKPRPLAKLHGKRGPTPEQAAAHADAMRAWNRAYRAASRAQKAQLAADNARFYAARCAT